MGFVGKEGVRRVNGRACDGEGEREAVVIFG